MIELKELRSHMNFATHMLRLARRRLHDPNDWAGVGLRLQEVNEWKYALSKTTDLMARRLYE